MSVDVQTRGPRLIVDGASAADLELLLRGVRLPWQRLGGRVDDASRPDGSAGTGSGTTPFTASVAVPLDVVSSLAGSRTVVLTDATCLPVAVLDDVALSDEDGSATVHGRLLTTTPVDGAFDGGFDGAAGWVPDDVPVVIAQRPLLDADLTGPLVVIAPSSATPTGVPAAVLRAALDATASLRPEVSVVDAPVWWRDGRSDTALVDALAQAVGRPVRVLADTDPEWVAANTALERGLEPTSLDPSVTAVLLRWRPPRSRRGLVVFFTGLSGSGKSTLASALVDRVERTGSRSVSLLDGDLVRRMLSSGLGFDRAGRDANVLRIGYVAAEIARHGGMAVCAPIAPFAAARDAVREMVQAAGDFVLVHVATPIEVCEERDRKGLYAQARSGALPEFTGVSSPYETPVDADLVVDTTGRTLEESLDEVVSHLRTAGWIA